MKNVVPANQIVLGSQQQCLGPDNHLVPWEAGPHSVHMVWGPDGREAPFCCHTCQGPVQDISWCHAQLLSSGHGSCEGIS
ncbi:hypothetical protein AAY473_023661 [Plecturocebus cupreus]